jgi:hypothetical protein
MIMGSVPWRGERPVRCDRERPVDRTGSRACTPRTCTTSWPSGRWRTSWSAPRSPARRAPPRGWWRSRPGRRRALLRGRARPGRPDRQRGGGGGGAAREVVHDPALDRLGVGARELGVVDARLDERASRRAKASKWQRIRESAALVNMCTWNTFSPSLSGRCHRQPARHASARSLCSSPMSIVSTLVEVPLTRDVAPRERGPQTGHALLRGGPLLCRLPLARLGPPGSSRSARSCRR